VVGDDRQVTRRAETASPSWGSRTGSASAASNAVRLRRTRRKSLDAEKVYCMSARGIAGSRVVRRWAGRRARTLRSSPGSVSPRKAIAIGDSTRTGHHHAC
jgi:hypothetical protein